MDDPRVGLTCDIHSGTTIDGRAAVLLCQPEDSSDRIQSETHRPRTDMTTRDRITLAGALACYPAMALLIYGVARLSTIIG